MEKRDFTKAMNVVKELEKYNRYLGAFVFGSVAHGDATEKSELDIKVIVEGDNCENVNTPFIENVLLIITFISFGQLEEQLNSQKKKGERAPVIAESIILFDKTGKLKKLKKKFENSTPQKLRKQDYQMAQFTIFWADNKICRALSAGDDLSAQLGMHAGLNDLLKIHYRINGKWFVGDKRLIIDLKSWDKDLSAKLISYLKESGAGKKYKIWLGMIGHILNPIGGRQDIKESQCTCTSCKKDLKKLYPA